MVCVCTCAYLQDWGRWTTRTTLFYSTFTQASNHSRDHARRNRRSLLVYWHCNNTTSSKPQTQSVSQLLRYWNRVRKSDLFKHIHTTTMWENMNTHPSWALAPGERQDAVVTRDNSGKGCSLGSPLRKTSSQVVWTNSVGERLKRKCVNYW